MTIIKDDRSTTQKTTHPYLVVGTESFLSGWGHAREGASYAAWACKADDVHEVFKWVENRSEMQRVRVIDERSGPYRPSRGCAHLHVYVVEPGHAAIQRDFAADSNPDAEPRPMGVTS